MDWTCIWVQVWGILNVPQQWTMKRLFEKQIVDHNGSPWHLVMHQQAPMISLRLRLRKLLPQRTLIFSIDRSTSYVLPFVKNVAAINKKKWTAKQCAKLPPRGFLKKKSYKYSHQPQANQKSTHLHSWGSRVFSTVCTKMKKHMLIVSDETNVDFDVGCPSLH